MEEAKKKRMRDIEKEAKRDKKDFATLIHNRIQQLGVFEGVLTSCNVRSV